ncbi:PREDICTED: uncharacterized protein LOC104766633 [Camelina sativa]|uniref:Uncharacterized protein LOC104766633 n=1 Tax=Camelina sativa TaxID=90675 RepID=A0ABM0XPA1_CAMSA|nr:PREDICTED: uncharacterized protein LOC104766633 [Camelina sativa]XP_010488853.1 PREDICTED: uncharacterized protein LOC104766633 [Camelina sativa]
MVGTRSHINRLDNEGEGVTMEEEKKVTPVETKNLLDRTQALEYAIANQNRKLDRNIAEMFQMIKIISGQKASQSSKQLEEQSPLMDSAAPESGGVSYEHSRGRGSTGPGQYSGVTRLGKVDFRRFDGERCSAWISTDVSTGPETRPGTLAPDQDTSGVLVSPLGKLGANMPRIIPMQPLGGRAHPGLQDTISTTSSKKSKRSTRPRQPLARPSVRPLSLPKDEGAKDVRIMTRTLFPYFGFVP